MEEIHRLRRVPVGALTVEDLRLLVGQEVALGVVVPLAVRLLEDDPLAEGDLLEGDLLAAVLRVPAVFWSGRPDLAGRLRARPADAGESVVARVPQVEAFLERRW
ncbi:contact-dependent growth inhibition system immunity protein [Catenuloplanes atrovinosus]|uniref:Uncharacterized protein n=1 Tax=Catenuloplanes atrovinosus TaxID=137266 RepID=A0AAE3YR38_9ACTN|nr:contact-dependent growth inhibition system immunity protein [Catenuloplanes atrovinosus]MDR7277150.1 hypothetical protein [Catenuloplanes atrovinosus]